MSLDFFFSLNTTARRERECVWGVGDAKQKPTRERDQTCQKNGWNRQRKSKGLKKESGPRKYNLKKKEQQRNRTANAKMENEQISPFLSARSPGVPRRDV